MFKCELTIVEPETTKMWQRILELPFVPVTGMYLSEIGCASPVGGHLIEIVVWNNEKQHFEVSLEDWRIDREPFPPDNVWKLIN